MSNTNSNDIQQINTFEKIYEIVRKIPQGKVATYGQIAMLACGDRNDKK